MRSNWYVHGLGPATLVVMAAALYAVFVYVPTEQTMGIVQRIFYFHVPSAWVALLAFFVVFLSGILYLSKRSRRWDIVGLASAEIGVLFCSLALVTGSIWAKPVWGAWWVWWDPRLTTTLVLWFIYVSYLMLRSAVGEGSRRAAFAAVFGIVGFVDVPIVFMSIRWWQTMHPVVFEGGDGGLAPSMLLTLLVSVAAFTLLYGYLLWHRVDLERIRDEVELLRQTVEEQALEGGSRPKGTTDKVEEAKAG